MRLLILSDLHLEWGQFDPPRSDSFDAVVLAGDIWQGPKAVRWAQRKSTFAGKPVIFVPGNHEFYGFERLRTLELMREAGLNSNVHVLDRQEVTLTGKSGNSVQFLGATLWTDFSANGADVAAAMAVARRRLYDFSAIREGEGAALHDFTPEDALFQHRMSRGWLLEQLKKPCPARTATVVVTHHGPSPLSIASEYANDPLNACFVSDLPIDFFLRAPLWIHGHVHSSFDYRVGATRVVANPRGYRSHDGSFENSRFRPDLVIDVEP